MNATTIRKQLVSVIAAATLGTSSLLGQQKAGMSMQFTTAALSTLRCLSDAGIEADKISLCHEPMNNTSDLARSSDERMAVARLSSFALSTLWLATAIRENIGDEQGAWEGGHPLASPAEKSAAYDQIDSMAINKRRRQFVDQATCKAAFDGQLRAGKLTQSTICSPFFALAKGRR